MYAAFRSLFASLAEHGPPLVVIIDDLQWSDLDSLALLGDLLSPPHAPPMLLIGTARSGTSIKLPCTVQRLFVDGLSPDDARQLAQHHLEHDGGSGSRAVALAEEAAGHPLFIAELARHARTAIPGPPTLDDALGARLEVLRDEPKALLELLAVAAGPIAHETLARACGQPADVHAHNVAFLRSEHLVRTGGDSIETYHDKVRAAVFKRLGEPALRLCHERLATGLEATPHADAESLAVHWQGAGQPKRAAQHAVHAAEHAAGGLAFDRAVRLYRMALELDPDRPDKAALNVQLAQALVNAGREVESADAYLAAAQATAPGPAAIDLKRRAAERLLASSQLGQRHSASAGHLGGAGERPVFPVLACSARGPVPSSRGKGGPSRPSRQGRCLRIGRGRLVHQQSSARAIAAQPLPSLCAGRR
jgi:predicted ATPase